MWKPIYTLAVVLIVTLAAIAGLVYLGTRFIIAPAYVPEVTVLRFPDGVQEAVLRAEVAELKSANEKMLTIMIWTLGVAAAVTTIFVTFNYAQYKYVAERERVVDREALSRELNTRLGQELEMLRVQNEENFSANVQTVKGQVAAEIDSVSRKIKEFEVELLDAEFKRLSSLVGTGTLPTMDFYTCLLALQRALEIHELRESLYPSMAVVEMQDMKINQALDQLESTVDRALTGHHRSDSATLNTMAAEVAKAPANHDVSKHRILEKLANRALH